MSVIGIDFGNESCYIAVARQGGIETIANDYSLRATPTCVAFGEKNRILGVAAQNQMTTNLRNTCRGFKILLGKQYRDPRVQKEYSGFSFDVVQSPDGGIGIKVKYLEDMRVFSPTEITAMLFTKLKQTAELALDTKVKDVVIGVPCFYDDTERHALLDAAAGAGLNVLRLLNETTATALCYGIYKQDLPSTEEKPRNVVFVDCGQSAIQVGIAAFNKGKLKMLATAADTNAGGREFDQLLANHFIAEFKSKYKVDVSKNKRLCVRLLAEVEKLKKQMSVISTELPLSIECFFDDKDVNSKCKRSILVDMAGGILQRIEKTLRQCLEDSLLRLDDIHSVEIVGGSSRIPSIKQLIEKVFQQSPSTTLNQDEAVARGCALQCAILSPTFKVREFAVTDVQPYSIQLVWKDDSGQEADMEVFPKNHQVPFSKMLTFYRKSPFMLQAQYSAPYPGPRAFIGHFTIKNVTPNSEGESQKVKVKVRVNLHGNFVIASASLTEKKDAGDDTQEAMESEDNKDQKDVNSSADSQQQQEMNTDQQANAEEQKPDESSKKQAESQSTKSEEKKNKKSVRVVDLEVASNVNALSATQVNELFERESEMMAADKKENDRINAKNAVEEYVYDLRGKLYEELEAYVSQEDREKASHLLDSTENWLYDEGEDCVKQVYVDKLEQLKKYGEPIKERRCERLELPRAFELLLVSVQKARKVCDLFHKGDEKYNHLDAADVEKVEKSLEEKQRWVDKSMGIISSTPTHCNVSITVSQVCSERTALEALVNPIINKPKPKPKVEEPPPAEKKAEKSEEGEQQSNGPTEDAKAKASNEPMDVD